MTVTTIRERGYVNPIVTLVDEADKRMQVLGERILLGRDKEIVLTHPDVLHAAYEELRARGWVKDPDAPKPEWPPRGKPPPPSWTDPRTRQGYTIRDAMRIEAGRIRRGE